MKRPQPKENRRTTNRRRGLWRARKFSARAGICGLLAFAPFPLPARANPASVQKKSQPVKTNSAAGSELRIVAANVQLLLIAPDGKKTGYDPKLQKEMRAIPDSAYYQDALLAYDSGRVDPNTTQTIDVRHPRTGQYKLLVSQGTAADGEEYEILVHLYRSEGSEVPVLRLSGTAKSGAPAAFKFVLDNGAARRLLRTDANR